MAETPNPFLDLPWHKAATPIPTPKKRRRRKAPPKPAHEAPKGRQKGTFEVPQEVLDAQVVTFRLATQHNLNGIIYGPGQTEAPRKVAQALIEADQRAIMGEFAFYGTKSSIVGPRTQQGSHRVTIVPDELFEAVAAEAPPIDTVSSKKVSSILAGLNEQF